MEMRMARMLGMSGLLVLGALGCGKVSGDHSKVIANVGNEKITEKAFGDTVKALVGDEVKAKELLTSEAARDQRNQILEQMVTQKALMRFAKSEGLDKDPKVQLAAEAAVANVYAKALIDKRMVAAEPTEAQLKALYDDFVKQSEAAGQKGGVPPFEQVKAQLPELWKRKQGQQASDTLLTQLKQLYPVVFAPEYKPSQPHF
jgi:hypothetical protein